MSAGGKPRHLSERIQVMPRNIKPGVCITITVRGHGNSDHYLTVDQALELAGLIHMAVIESKGKGGR